MILGLSRRLTNSGSDPFVINRVRTRGLTPMVINQHCLQPAPARLKFLILARVSLVPALHSGQFLGTVPANLSKPKWGLTPMANEPGV